MREFDFIRCIEDGSLKKADECTEERLVHILPHLE